MAARSLSLLVLLQFGALLPRVAALSLQLPYRRAAVFVDGSVADVLANVSACDAAVVVVVSGGPGARPPVRQQPGQPLLSFSHAVEKALPGGVRRVLLSGLQQVEALRPGRLFALQLGALPEQPPAAAGRAGAAASPWAVMDVSAGRLQLHPQLLQQLRSTPAEAAAVLADACLRSMAHLVQRAQQAFPASLQHLTGHVSAAAAAGVAASFAAAAVPKWFCFACPIVLGLLAPLVINSSVGEAANLACKALQLPDDECVDLWFAALALGMILSLLSAIPIFKVCRLAECAHPGNATRATAVS